MSDAIQQCGGCGKNVKMLWGARCSKCIAAERTARETFRVDGPSQKARYEAIHGYGAADDLHKRIREREALLEKYLGSREIRKAEEDVGEDE